MWQESRIWMARFGFAFVVEVKASRERGFKRSAAEGVTFLRANGSTKAEN